MDEENKTMSEWWKGERERGGRKRENTMKRQWKKGKVNRKWDNENKEWREN